jgi:2-phosphosulfolactate phosphatase
METTILHVIEGARKATGLVVIIDVFRAFTTACYIVQNNAARVFPVGDIDIAYRMKAENPETILIGERNEQIPEGFQYGNSPSEIKKTDFTGKTVVLSTTAGTNGIANAINADEIITGSMVNADAIVRYIRQQQPKQVSLVCMGFRAEKPSDEDTFCAEYIQAKLNNKPYDYTSKIPLLKKGAGSRFFIPEKQHYAPENDFYLCTKIGIFDFVLKVVKRTQIAQIERIFIDQVSENL